MKGRGIHRSRLVLVKNMLSPSSLISWGDISLSNWNSHQSRSLINLETFICLSPCEIGRAQQSASVKLAIVTNTKNILSAPVVVFPSQLGAAFERSWCISMKLSICPIVTVLWRGGMSWKVFDGLNGTLKPGKSANNGVGRWLWWP